MTVSGPFRTGTIYLLQARLDEPPLPVSQLAVAVTDDERERAARFMYEQDQRRHLIGRGLLRIFLARRLGCDPTALHFRTTEQGKPFLEDGPGFNISHSGNVVLIAVVGEGRIGVDVEAVRPLPDLAQLARLSFAPDEVDSVMRLEPDDRLRPFFRTWARKEAMLKALGVGITALEAISVSTSESSENALLRLDWPNESAAGWSVRSFACGRESEAAVAWDRPLHEIALLAPPAW